MPSVILFTPYISSSSNSYLVGPIFLFLIWVVSWTNISVISISWACVSVHNIIPLLGHTTKVSDYITIPVFAVQVTLFPNCGICIGTTNHHGLGDASTTFCFLKAWTSIAQSGGSNENFLASGTLSIYDRLMKYPKLDEIYLKKAIVETFNEEYKLPRLCRPTDKVRATFILSRTVINGLKELVSTQLPALAYVS
ncbi:putative anthocyanin 6''-O-malonyltransferase [Helianthus annuus]|nr:putative anthocyanin 6''-O-malonyltransferase [Helianthus annuus]KAJ0656087.1 putative anthocyanin 6''-O-malonyltransferase [Helianthus annuus]